MTQLELDRLIAAGSPAARTVFLVVAVVAGVAVMLEDARRWPIPRHHQVGVFVAAFAGGFAGAFLPSFLAGGLVGGQIRERGVPMTILGALVFSFVAVAAYKRILGISWDTSDAFARGTCLEMALGRLGCHVYHCCPGIVSPIPMLGVDFGDGLLRIPIQLAEALGMLVLFAIFSWLEREDLFRHRRLFLMFLAYGLLRFGLEFGREPMGATWLGLGAYHWFALVLATLGAWQVRRRTLRLASEPHP